MDRRFLLDLLGLLELARRRLVSIRFGVIILHRNISRAIKKISENESAKL
jgi:hypothetical protein